MAYRNYANSNGFIVATDGTGDFTTITSALTASSSGDTIFVRDGTYTENLTLKAGVVVTALNGDQNQPTVTIVGKCSFSAAGTATIANIRLQTNSDYFLSVTGSSASIVQLFNCYLNCTNNTGIEYTSSSSSSIINILWSTGNITTTGITYFSATSTGYLGFFNCSMGNTGGSTTASTMSAGSLSINQSFFSVPVTTSSTNSFGGRSNTFSVTNTTPVTVGGSSTNDLNFCNFLGGTASALSIGSGASCFVQNCQLSSTNTNAITGAGSVSYGGLVFPQSSKVINTTTQAGLNSGTFTPALAFGGGSTGITYSSRTGVYTRIDNLCYFAISIALTSKGSSTGFATVGGLPYVPSTVIDYVDYYMEIAPLSPPVGTTGFEAYFGAGGSTMGLAYVTAGSGGIGNLTDAHFQNGTGLRINGWFHI